MVRLFKHYVSQGLLTLLLAEALSNFLSIYLGRALEVVLLGYNELPRLSEVTPNSIIFMFVMMINMIAIGLYERNFWSGKNDMLLRVVISFLFGLFAMTFIYYLSPDIYYNRRELSLGVGIAFINVSLLRAIFFMASDHGTLRHQVLILGVGQQAARIEELWEKSKISSRIVGYIQVHENEKPLVPEERMLQVTDRLLNLASALTIDEIVVAMDDRRKGFPVDEIMQCKFNGIMISNFLNFYEKETGKIQLDALRPSNMIFAPGFRKTFYKQVIKRLFDLTASLFLLTLTWPLMLLAALAVWIESGGHGPILYRQIRVGLNEKPFNVLKIRSMQVDAERDGIARWAQAKDNRITRTGALLRKTRIDELPQLLNVLWGNMSFVGPRPERPQFVAELCEKIPFYSMRHIVKPGITGWAQICYPYGASIEDAKEKLQYDLYYIKNYSFAFDTLILLQTVHAVFWSEGAH